MSTREFKPNKILKPPGDFSEALKHLHQENFFDIEIGCGVGYHPIQYAKAHPERTLFAIERTTEKFNKFSRRLENHLDIKNVIAIHADAIAWISHFVPQETISRYFILYPNPHPKERQSNLRFANMLFMGHLFKTLKPGGTLTMATNIESYYEEARLKMIQNWGFELVETSTVSPQDEPRSHFERKYLADHQTCFNLQFRRPL